MTIDITFNICQSSAESSIFSGIRLSSDYLTIKPMNILTHPVVLTRSSPLQNLVGFVLIRLFARSKSFLLISSHLTEYFRIGDKVKSGPSPLFFVLVAFGCVLALGFAMVRLSRPRPKKGGLLD